MACFVFLLLLLAAATKGEMLCAAGDGKPPPESARSRLHGDLFCLYDRETAPERPLNINAEVFMRRTRVFHGSLVAEVLATLQWSDPRLTWDPASYDGVRLVQLSSAVIWIPPIVTYNTLPWSWEEGRRPADFWPVPCTVSSAGNVSCSSATEMGGPCTVSALYWPHAEANCFSFIGRDLRMNEDISIVFSNMSHQDEMSYYVPGNEWILTDLVKENVSLGLNQYVLAFKLTLHSRGTNVAAALIGPAVVLSLMLLGSFILPITSFTRLGLCCCCTFGTVLASSLLFEYLEPYPDPTPLVVTFYNGLLILSTIATFMVLLLNVVVTKSRKASEAPRWLYSFQTWLFHSGAGKLWLKSLALTPPGQNYCQAIELMPALHMQRGEIPGMVNSENEDSQAASNGDAASNEMSNAHQSSGPHKIWDFTACFLNRCLCIIFLVAIVILGLCLAHAITYYKDLDIIV